MGCRSPGRSVRDIVRSGARPDRNKLTGSGREFQKHQNGSRKNIPENRFVGSNPEKLNQAGSNMMREILSQPEKQVTEGIKNRFGKFYDIKIPDGRGVRPNENKEFLHFLDPPETP